MEAYYFQQLNKEQQHIYHAILKGVQNLENEFLVPACDRETLYNLFFSDASGSSGDFLGDGISV